MSFTLDQTPKTEEEIATGILAQLTKDKEAGFKIASFVIGPDFMGVTTSYTLPELALGLIAAGVLTYALPPVSIDEAIEIATSYLKEGHTAH